MLRRASVPLLALALVLLGGACSTGDDGGETASTSTVPTTTTAGGTTVSSAGTTQQSSTSEPTTPASFEPVPPVTPPANQPEACMVLAAATDLGAETLTPQDQPQGQPAPSTGCRTTADDPVSLALFYGQDPLETLAVVRSLQPAGADVTGVGQDAYFVEGSLFVDTGGRAFAVVGALTQQQLVDLAQDVIDNL